jgi:hypothetical protein
LSRWRLAIGHAGYKLSEESADFFRLGGAVIQPGYQLGQFAPGRSFIFHGAPLCAPLGKTPRQPGKGSRLVGWPA